MLKKKSNEVPVRELVEKHHHHYHNEDWIAFVIKSLACVFVFIVLINLVQAGISLLQEDSIDFKHCLTACSQKHFMGLELGIDAGAECTKVKEFDRTDCIENCIDMYLILENKVYTGTKYIPIQIN